MKFKNLNMDACISIFFVLFYVAMFAALMTGCATFRFNNL